MCCRRKVRIVKVRGGAVVLDNGVPVLFERDVDTGYFVRDGSGYNSRRVIWKPPKKRRGF